jgi:GDPmannose 4,6-dehydratase
MTLPPKALILGITGQDGSFLSELLLSKGYEVHGIIRRASHFNTSRIDHLYQENEQGDTPPRFFLHYGDLTDASSLRHVIEKVGPQEVYNLAAQSHVKVSFDLPDYTVNVDALGCLRLLDAIRDYQDRTGAMVKFYQAGSSEMYGNAPSPQSEATPFHPRSPYACAKAYSFWQTINYRESYQMFACNGILFNHESERRGETFVTRKITRAATRIHLGLQKQLVLGHLTAKRDWGFAGDYVEAIWKMLQAPTPDDYVVATGVSHSVQTFLEKVFTSLDLDPDQYVVSDPRYYRPSEVEDLCGNPTKIQAQLGWQSNMTFDQLIERMVSHDLKLAQQEQLLLKAGTP